MVTHIDVFRVRVRHGVNCHLDRTLIILENLDARIPKIRQYKTPHVPQEKRLLKAFCHCNVLGLSVGESAALLRPRNPLDCRTPSHHGYTRDRLHLRILGGISGVRVNHQL